jgi:DNA-binding response OmpR family regulator
MKGSRRVLIVDDENDITEAIKTGLESHGFDVDTYNDPTIALSKFRRKQYDVALLDIRMPRMTGFELYRKLKDIDSELIVSLFSAFDMYEEEFQRMFPDVKVKTIFRKPIRIAELVTRLNELLNSS